MNYKGLNSLIRQPEHPQALFGRVSRPPLTQKVLPDNPPKVACTSCLNHVLESGTIMALSFYDLLPCSKWIGKETMPLWRAINIFCHWYTEKNLLNLSGLFSLPFPAKTGKKHATASGISLTVIAMHANAEKNAFAKETSNFRFAC